MGRSLGTVDVEALYDLMDRGVSFKDTASELDMSIPTLSRRIAEIQENQGVLLQYRTVQALQLTALQARILDAITPEKIAEAPLKDLVSAYKILKDKEHLMDGKPTEIQGLVGYLVQMEREDCKNRRIEHLPGEGSRLANTNALGARTDGSSNECEAEEEDEVDEDSWMPKLD